MTVPGVTEQERDLMLECAKNQLKWLKESQGLFLKARQLVISQKHHLYKYDELEMCIARCAPRELSFCPCSYEVRITIVCRTSTDTLGKTILLFHSLIFYCMLCSHSCAK